MGLKGWFTRGIVFSVIIAAVLYIFELFPFAGLAEEIGVSVIAGFVLSTLISLFSRKKAVSRGI